MVGVKLQINYTFVVLKFVVKVYGAKQFTTLETTQVKFFQSNSNLCYHCSNHNYTSLIVNAYQCISVSGMAHSQICHGAMLLILMFFSYNQICLNDIVRVESIQHKGHRIQSVYNPLTSKLAVVSIILTHFIVLYCIGTIQYQL